MADPLIVFDMDGVLVDVTDSYRETVVRTVAHFTGAEITRAEIQDYKNQGGWNDDWQLSHHIIGRHGVEVDFPTVVAYYQKLFHGQDGEPGLILRERWLAQVGVLERLSERYDFALFTGRPRAEAQYTLRRFAPGLRFAPIVGMEDVTAHKPAPEGLLKITAEARGRKTWYIGDTVDDARCARDAAVPFIGIAAPANPRYSELVSVLRDQMAVAVLDSLNQLEDVLG